jgi:thioredoxin-like negative regulator of GroEL
MNKLIYVLLLIAAVWGAALLYVNRPKLIVEVTGQTQFSKHTDEDSGCVIVMFSSGRCPRCSRTLEILSEIGEPYQEELTVVVIDCNKDVAICNEYGIKYVPLFIIFKDGRRQGRPVRLRYRENLVAFIKHACEGQMSR